MLGGVRSLEWVLKPATKNEINKQVKNAGNPEVYPHIPKVNASLACCVGFPEPGLSERESFEKQISQLNATLEHLSRSFLFPTIYPVPKDTEALSRWRGVLQEWVVANPLSALSACWDNRLYMNPVDDDYKQQPVWLNAEVAYARYREANAYAASDFNVALEADITDFIADHPEYDSARGREAVRKHFIDETVFLLTLMESAEEVLKGLKQMGVNDLAAARNQLKPGIATQRSFLLYGHDLPRVMKDAQKHALEIGYVFSSLQYVKLEFALETARSEPMSPRPAFLQQPLSVIEIRELQSKAQASASPIPGITPVVANIPTPIIQAQQPLQDVTMLSSGDEVEPSTSNPTTPPRTPTPSASPPRTPPASPPRSGSTAGGGTFDIYRALAMYSQGVAQAGRGPEYTAACGAILIKRLQQDAAHDQANSDMLYSSTSSSGASAAAGFLPFNGASHGGAAVAVGAGLSTNGANGNGHLVVVPNGGGNRLR